MQRRAREGGGGGSSAEERRGRKGRGGRADRRCPAKARTEPPASNAAQSIRGGPLSVDRGVDGRWRGEKNADSARANAAATERRGAGEGGRALKAATAAADGTSFRTVRTEGNLAGRERGSTRTAECCVISSGRHERSTASTRSRW